MIGQPMPYFFKFNDGVADEEVLLMDTPSEDFMEDVRDEGESEVTIISFEVGDMEVDDSYEEHVVVPKALIYQAISCMSYDATNAYQAGATKYADRRHGTSRGLAEYVERKYTDFPETGLSFPKELWEDLDEMKRE